MWSWVSRDSVLRMTALTKTSSNCKDRPILLSERMLHKAYYPLVFSWKIKLQVVGLKCLVTKTNWLAVNRQSWSNSDSDQFSWLKWSEVKWSEVKWSEVVGWWVREFCCQLSVESQTVKRRLRRLVWNGRLPGTQLVKGLAVQLRRGRYDSLLELAVDKSSVAGYSWDINDVSAGSWGISTVRSRC
jgi:hypothetical protein